MEIQFDVFAVIALLSLALVAWRSIVALSSVSGADKRERDRERLDNLRMISQLVEKIQSPTHNFAELQHQHMVERMDAARCATNQEIHANRDGRTNQNPVAPAVEQDEFRAYGQ